MGKKEGEKEEYQPRHPSRRKDEEINDSLEHYEPKTTFQRVCAMGSAKVETDDVIKTQSTATAGHKEMVNDCANGKGTETNGALQYIDDGSSNDNVLKKSPTDSGQRARALQYLDDGSEVDCAPMPPANAAAAAASRPNAMQRASEAGAYSSRGLHRRQKPAASAIGVHPLQAEEARSSSVHNVASVEEEGAVPRSSSKAGLVEALPVHEEVAPDMEAQPVDLSAEEIKRGREKTKLYQYMMVLVVCLGLVVGGILAGVLGTRNNNGTSSPTRFPSMAPSMAPSGAPSSAPTGSLDMLLAMLPNYTLESLKNYSTPQWNAYDWLSNHPDLPEMPLWRETQLFALATFYYAMKGPQWPEEIRERWLVYGAHECLWFSSSFGGFFFGEYTDQAIENVVDFEGVDPCNSEDEFQYLNLANLQLEGLQPTIPPEISLLTTLTGFSLTFDDVKEPLMETLPTEMWQLTKLSGLSLGRQVWNGTLPSQVGLLTDLEDLLLFGNELTGPIPTELGLLTSMTRLYFDKSSFTGSLPTEMGLLTSMVDMQLYDNSLTGTIPTELGLLSNATTLFLDGNSFTGRIPSELGSLTSMVWLALYNNRLSGFVPSQMGSLTIMTRLSLYGNLLTGPIPTLFGLLSSIQQVFLYDNFLTGPIPTELGLLTNMFELSLKSNILTGMLPTQMAAMTSLTAMYVDNIGLTGTIPSELGLIASMESLSLHDNSFSGLIPSELALMVNLCMASFANNSFTGTIPSELDNLVSNGSLEELNLEDNYLSGTVSADLCLLGQSSWGPGLSFDCGLELCGCCWCACPGINATDTTCTDTLDPPGWPGIFPSPVNAGNQITINIFTDDHPEDLKWEWSQRSGASLWNALESNAPLGVRSLNSYTRQVESGSLYRLQLLDSFGDGICCEAGYGWFTITNSTPSLDHEEGTVIRGATGDALQSSLDIFIFITEDGHAMLVDNDSSSF